ncbi:hypothetical protein KKH3_10580 [Pectobacterium actinidiae]|nr:hypothetical protein KKH3_10580 [Pectobacterium actinidiae]
MPFFIYGTVFACYYPVKGCFCIFLDITSASSSLLEQVTHQIGAEL